MKSLLSSIGTIIGWILGILLFFTAITSTHRGIPVAILTLVMAGLFIPPSSRYISKMVGRYPTTKKVIIYFVCMFLIVPLHAPMSYYTVLNEVVEEHPTKDFVELEILVYDDLSEDAIANALKFLYKKYERKIDGRFTMRIFAYQDQSYVESKGWIAMLGKAANDSKPEISFNDRQLGQVGKSEEQIDGLTESQRRGVWNQYIKAQDRARDEGNTKYPEPDLGAGFDKDSYLKYMTIKEDYIDELSEKYEREVAILNNLTYKELKTISHEGATKDWPFPPR